MALEKLSASKLHALIAKRDAAVSALNSGFIANAWGNMRYSDIREAAKDPSAPAHALSVRYLKADAALMEARDELAARKRWHGGDKPIKRRD